MGYTQWAQRVVTYAGCICSHLVCTGYCSTCIAMFGIALQNGLMLEVHSNGDRLGRPIYTTVQTLS